MSEPRGRVVVVGNATVDLIQRMPALPRPGETVLADALERCAGGKGLNQAVAAARAGATVRLIAPIGDDPDGAFLRAALASETGLTAEWHACPAPTDVSAIWIAEGGENMIASSAMAARSLTPEHVAAGLAALAPGDALVLQGNLTADATLAAARLGRDRAARVVLNTAPIAWDMRPLLPLVDVVVANEPEALSLTGLGGAPALEALRALGAVCAIVTRGADGALLDAGGGIMPIAAPRVRAMDTAGAGDVTVGTLAAGLAAGGTVADALRLAVAAASLSVTRLGTTPSFPTRAEIAQLRDAPAST
jgi:ribokinase